LAFLAFLAFFAFFAIGRIPPFRSGYAEVLARACRGSCRLALGPLMPAVLRASRRASRGRAMWRKGRGSRETAPCKRLAYFFFFAAFFFAAFFAFFAIVLS
jgi:hypothetical protein